MLRPTTPITPDLIRRTFFNTSIADIFRAAQGGSLVGAYTLLFCSINAIAYIDESTRPQAAENSEVCQACMQRKGPTKDSKAFQQWVKRWIKNGIPSPNTDPYFLYVVRNSLVHVYGMPDALKGYAGYLLRHDDPANHWKKFGGGTYRTGENLTKIRSGYMLNFETLLSEYVIAASYFFKLNEPSWTEDEDIQLAICRLLGMVQFKDDGSPVYAEPPRKFGDMHPCLALFDNFNDPTMAEMQQEIHKIFLLTGQCVCLYPRSAYPVQCD